MIIKFNSGSYLFTFLLNTHKTNNSIQFFIIYVPSQQLQGQLQTQHSVDANNYIMDKHNKSQREIIGKHWKNSTLMQKSKQKNKRSIIMIIIISLIQIEVITENW
jgi:hypothetical protein